MTQTYEDTTPFYFNTIKQEWLNPCYDFLCNVSYTQWFSIFMYGAIIFTLIIVINVEHGELFNRGQGIKYINKYNNGASYYKGKPKQDDDLETLLRKIRISCRHDVAGVYWRRSLIFAIISSFFVLVLVLQRLPTGLEWLIALLIIYFLTYSMFNWYREMVSKPACEQVNKATKIILNNIL